MPKHGQFLATGAVGLTAGGFSSLHPDGRGALLTAVQRENRISRSVRVR